MHKRGMLGVLAWIGSGTAFTFLSGKLLKPIVGVMVLPVHAAGLRARKVPPAPRMADCGAARSEAIRACKRQYNPIIHAGDVGKQQETLARQEFCITGVVAAYDACVATDGDTEIARVAITDHFSMAEPPEGAKPENRQLGIDMFFAACDSADEA